MVDAAADVVAVCPDSINRAAGGAGLVRTLHAWAWRRRCHGRVDGFREHKCCAVSLPESIAMMNQRTDWRLRERLRPHCPPHERVKRRALERKQCPGAKTPRRLCHDTAGPAIKRIRRIVPVCFGDAGCECPPHGRSRAADQDHNTGRLVDAILRHRCEAAATDHASRRDGIADSGEEHGRYCGACRQTWSSHAPPRQEVTARESAPGSQCQGVTARESPPGSHRPGVSASARVIFRVIYCSSPVPRST